MYTKCLAGFTVKNVTSEGYDIEGPLVMFNSVDLDGEQFLPTTDYGLDEGGTKSTDIYFHHGLDPIVGKRVLGKGIISKRESDLWLDGQIKIRDEYDRHILSLVSTKKVGLSSGTAPHLAEKAVVDGVKTWIRWPVGLDASITPTPAEPKNIVSVKTEVKSKDETQMADVEAESTNEVDGIKTSLQEFAVKYDGKLTEIGDVLKALTTRLEDLPTKSKLGFVSETGGKTDQTIKSFGDYLLAVKRKDTVRLKTVYGSQYETVKDMTVDVGTSGGYAVPHEYRTDILKLAVESSEILPLVTQIPVGTMSGPWPSLDQTIAADNAGNGQTSMAAGILPVQREPGAAFTEDTPQLSELNWTVRSIGGYTQVQNELSADSPLAIESLLRSLFVIAISAKNERNLFRGSGAGEFLGILNAPCAVGVTPANNSVFAWADALSMMAHFKTINPAKVAWAIHPSIIPDIGQFETTGGGAVLQPNLASPLGVNILGKPIKQSEHLPQANYSGCVVLGDFSAYLMFMRNELIVDFSEHVGFLNGLDTWRYYQRADGKPWLKNKITLADPQGSYYQSPFVYFDD